MLRHYGKETLGVCSGNAQDNISRRARLKKETTRKTEVVKKLEDGDE